LDPLERLSLAAQTQQRFTLEVEQIRLTHDGRVRQIATRNDSGERASDPGVVFGDAAGALR
jgi:hypothetical protein